MQNFTCKVGKRKRVKWSKKGAKRMLKIMRKRDKNEVRTAVKNAAKK